ncbi:MAG: flagellar protein FlgN [Peptostreptococcaceae bacterium]|nr:flagellar protein FlgN [Peptostreptococcaceae bacterium]
MIEQIRDLIESLIALNTQKIDLLEEILDHTKQQQVLISSNSLNSLMEIVKRKQEVMDRIDDIDRNFYLSFVQLKECLGVESIEEIDPLAHPEILRLKSTVNLVMRSLEAIEELDRRNLKEVQSEIDKVKESMRSVQEQKKISKGYGTGNSAYAADSQGFYIDGKK